MAPNMQTLDQTRGGLPHFGIWKLPALAIGLLLGYLLWTVVYNLFFHPLRKFPGPKLQAITRIPYTRMMLSGLSHKHHLELHKKYGPVIRMAPDLLSINHPDAMKDLRGHRKPGEPEHGKDPRVTTRSRTNIVGSTHEDHTRFRRALSHGFSAQAMMEQQPTIKKYVDQLFDQLDFACKSGNETVDLVKWYNYTTFDIIGDLAFGESFGCLENSTYHPWVSTVFKTVKNLAFLVETDQYPLFSLPLKLLLPRDFASKYAENRMLSEMKVQKRLDTKAMKPDFIGKMLEVRGSKQTNLTFKELASNASVLVIAGSETTATVLSAVTYFLGRDSRIMALLAEEVRSTYANADDIDLVNTQSLRYTQAVLDECLRMYPPAPSTTPRKISRGGDMIAGYFVPENTIVESEMYSLHCNPDYFTQSEDFIPERWLGDERFKNDRLEAVRTFSVGPRNCIGTNLAYSEMRLILARMIWKYDITLAESTKDWYERSRVYMVWQKPSLEAYLSPRKDL